MFKPLLRTLPTLTGNFSLACEVNPNNEYIQRASMCPLHEDAYNSHMNVALLTDRYEYNIHDYYVRYQSNFFNDMYSYDDKYVDNLDLVSANRPQSRNTAFEFGCSRISYQTFNHQFSFFAPIYINDINDLPNAFVINIEFKNTKIKKKIRVKIKELINGKPDNKNYLYIYLKRYLEQIDYRCIYCLPNLQQATYYGVDIVHGGLNTATDNIFNLIYNQYMSKNEYDLTICEGFQRNGLIMRQIIPLSFIFNINDFLDTTELQIYKNSNMVITGYYERNGMQVDMYDLLTNYKELIIDDVNVLGKVNELSLNESEATNYKYDNTVSPHQCHWQIYQDISSNVYNTNEYIVNSSASFDNDTNYVYGDFPQLYDNSSSYIYINDDNIIVENMCKLDPSIKNAIKTNIFFTETTQTIDSLLNSSNIENVGWIPINSQEVYYKGIKYNLDNIYNPILSNTTTYFGVFAYLHIIDSNLYTKACRSLDSNDSYVFGSKDVFSYTFNDKLSLINNYYSNDVAFVSYEDMSNVFGDGFDSSKVWLDATDYYNAYNKYSPNIALEEPQMFELTYVTSYIALLFNDSNLYKDLAEISFNEDSLLIDQLHSSYLIWYSINDNIEKYELSLENLDEVKSLISTHKISIYLKTILSDLNSNYYNIHIDERQKAIDEYGEYMFEPSMSIYGINSTDVNEYVTNSMIPHINRLSKTVFALALNLDNYLAALKTNISSSEINSSEIIDKINNVIDYVNDNTQLAYVKFIDDAHLELTKKLANSAGVEFNKYSDNTIITYIKNETTHNYVFNHYDHLTKDQKANIDRAFGLLPVVIMNDMMYELYESNIIDLLLYTRDIYGNNIYVNSGSKNFVNINDIILDNSYIKHTSYEFINDNNEVMSSDVPILFPLNDIYIYGNSSIEETKDIIRSKNISNTYILDPNDQSQNIRLFDYYPIETLRIYNIYDDSDNDIRDNSYEKVSPIMVNLHDGINVVNKDNKDFIYVYLDIYAFNDNLSFNIYSDSDNNTTIDIDNINNYSLEWLMPYMKTNLFYDHFTNYLSNIVLYPTQLSLRDNLKYNEYNNIIEKTQFKNQVHLTRYFGDIVPYIVHIDDNNITYNNSYMMLYKTFSIADDKDDVMVRLDMSYNGDKIMQNIYKYPGVQVIDTINGVPRQIIEDNPEYKYYNDNKLWNLDTKFTIIYPKHIQQDEVYKYMNDQFVIDEIFLPYMSQYISQIDENDTLKLFLFNQYKVKYMSTPTKLSTSSNYKMYELKYEFSLR